MHISFKRLLLVGIFCIALSFQGCSPATGKTTPDEFAQAIAAFSEYVESRMVQDHIPGLTIGFLKDGFSWAQGYGFADLENRVPAGPDSAYRLASVSKTFTALAVLQLVEQGKIDLEAEVQAYVPDFPRKEWPVTVRLLLGHLGGISHYRNYDLESHIKDPKDTREALAIFQDFELVAEPGTKYHYSSYGFNLLAAVVEAASGQPFGRYLRENILQPLGMDSSRLDDPTDLISNRVRGYRLIKREIKNSEYVDISSRLGGGGMRSTIPDLLKYAEALCEGRMLEPGTWQQMFTSMATRQGRFTGYGMGWNVRPWKGHFQVSHGGSQPETRTYLLIFPNEDFAVAIGANLEDAGLMPYVRRLAELVLEEDLDSRAYLPDSLEQILYNTCSQLAFEGMSRFDFLRQALTEDEQELAQAFAYFRTHVDPDFIRTDPMTAKAAVEGGFHPVENEAFVRVGTHMASVLHEAMGAERWASYRQDPLAFLSDYQKMAHSGFSISEPLMQLIRAWQEDWAQTYTEQVRKLVITPDSDFQALGKTLRGRFSGARIVPDLSREMIDAADFYLEAEDPDKSLEILGLSAALYPSHPELFLGMAVAHMRKGDVERSRALYRQAHALSPIPLGHFEYQAERLKDSGKIEELKALAGIALDLNPENALLHAEVGDMYLSLGDMARAADLFQRALELDPKAPGVREKLEALRKK